MNVLRLCSGNFKGRFFACFQTKKAIMNQKQSRQFLGTVTVVTYRCRLQAYSESQVHMNILYNVLVGLLVPIHRVWAELSCDCAMLPAPLTVVVWCLKVFTAEELYALKIAVASTRPWKLVSTRRHFLVSAHSRQTLQRCTLTLKGRSVLAPWVGSRKFRTRKFSDK